MSALRVALIGSGYIARVKHLPALRNLRKQAHAVAICDLNDEQARKLATEFEVPAVYRDLTQMLDQEGPDVVDICTPPKTHAPIALECINSGANVLIEKPMCQTVEECDQVIAAAERHNRKICVAHSDLFYPGFVKARQMVGAGAIGEFRGMRIYLSTPTDYITSKPDHWAHKLPGGVLGETGPHAVYMTLAFINPIDKVHVLARKVLDQYPWSPYEDYRLDLVGHDATSTVTMMYTTKQWAAQVDIWGTDGNITVDLESQTLVHYQRRELKAIPVGLSSLGQATQILKSGARIALRKLTRRYTQTHQEIMRAFFRSIDDNTASPVPGDQGREAIRVMNLITQQL